MACVHRNARIEVLRSHRPIEVVAEQVFVGIIIHRNLASRHASAVDCNVLSERSILAGLILEFACEISSVLRHVGAVGLGDLVRVPCRACQVWTKLPVIGLVRHLILPNRLILKQKGKQPVLLTLKLSRLDDWHLNVLASVRSHLSWQRNIDLDPQII